MKRIALFFMFVPLSIMAQSHNEIIWNYANDRIGEKVGKGMCGDLVQSAYSQFCDSKIMINVGLNGKGNINLGREIPKDSIIPGDVVLFRYRKKDTGKEITGHIAIVYAVSETNMSVIQQNYVGKEVSVEVWGDVTEIRSDHTQEIIFYRPY